MKGKFAAALRPLALTVFLAGLGWLSAAAMSGCSLLADDSGPSVAAPRVSSIKFEKAAVTVDSSVGEYIKYHVEPAAIQNSVTMAWDYDKDVISIDPDRFGVIVNGKKLGATYLRASADGVSATVLINVAGNPDVFEGEPYIYSDFQVVELTPGSSTTVTASLYGGSSADYEDMTWSIKDPTVADINWARGSCVIQAKRVGATQVTVHHPKSAYDYTMVVFVYTDAMTAPYITTGQNIVVINKTSETQKTLNFAVRNPVREDYAHPLLDWARGSRLVLMTAHRRENFGEPFANIFSAVRRAVEETPDVKLVYPVHLNPNVREAAKALEGCDRIKLTEPLGVLDFHNMLARCCLALTDSGGIQEDAPALNKPVLVLRHTTERPEGVATGALKLVGTDETAVYAEFRRLLDDEAESARMASAANPYGDGNAASRIADVLFS